jgi:hypothetical protein
MLQDNTEYINNNGQRIFIVTRTRAYPQFVYSRGGDWYDRETGNFCYFNRSVGNYTTDISCMRSISNHTPQPCQEIDTLHSSQSS